MTATLTRPASTAPRGLLPLAWHRPPLIFAGAMVVLAIVAVIGMLVDNREITGLNVWTKPLKFALSTAIYSVTLSWLVSLVVRRARVARIASTVATVGLAIELVIITAFAVTGDTSHFNVTTPLHTAAWAVMATSISVVWVMTFVIGVLLWRADLGDPARTLAIRSAVVIALIGMGLGMLMTGPNAEQLSDFQGVAGAHTVGLADGGPGLPLLGWSTAAGDLRIPHFLGMHALQALPILVIVLELLGRRVAILRDVTLRVRLVATAAVGILTLVAIVAVQALSGQSIVQPSAPFAVAFAGLFVAGAVAVIAFGIAANRRSRAPRAAGARTR